MTLKTLYRQVRIAALTAEGEESQWMLKMSCAKEEDLLNGVSFHSSDELSESRNTHKFRGTYRKLEISMFQKLALDLNRWTQTRCTFL